MRIKVLLFVMVAIVVVSGLTGAVLGTKGVVGGKEKTFTIEARQFAYDPSIIRVNRGDKVSLRLISKDVIHGFYLDAYGIDLEVLPGGRAVSASFVANKVGRFGFRCSRTCGVFHPFMMGILIVEPNYLFPGSIGLAIGVAVASLLFIAVRKEE